MPASTVLIVFGSWGILLVLAILYYVFWSRRPEHPERDEDQ
jgi:hypothetical protein